MTAEVIAVHTVAVLDAVDDGFVGGVAAHFELYDWHHAALLA